MTWDKFFYPHTVRVRPKNGNGGFGPSHGPAVELHAEVKDQQTLVRGPDGSEVVSNTQVTLPLPAKVPLGSLVTVWPGTAQEREARVLSAAHNPNDPPLDAFLLLSLE